MAVRVLWVPTTEDSLDRLSRADINPCARQGHQTATLAWVAKHANPTAYQVRWWVGETGHEGEWHERRFDLDASPKPRLADVKGFAELMTTVTPWEVEITLLGTRYRDGRPESHSVVWTFGHCK